MIICVPSLPYHKSYITYLKFSLVYLCSMQDLTPEIRLQTTRSGGKGGQNVNKVETAVIAYFPVTESALLTPEQKERIHQKLTNRINSEGALVVRSQAYRTQMENKQDAIRKVHELVTSALERKKARIATKPSRAAKARRIESKKMTGERKSGRQNLRPGDF
jgi:ribosome-associated protein